MGAAAADYDNDGDTDLFVAGVGVRQLYRNNGGKFEDVAAAAETDLAGDRRSGEAGRDRGLLDGRAGRVGAEVDRDIAVRRCGRARGGDGAAVLDQAQGPRPVDDRDCRAVSAGGGLDLAAVGRGESQQCTEHRPHARCPADGESRTDS